MHHPIGPQGKVINFREAWKKSIEKYQPKVPSRLNEVSHRFAEKLNVDKPKRVTAGHVVPPTDDDDRIKFISMIDHKPIKPSYLDLIPFKNFAKKELDA